MKTELRIPAIVSLLSTSRAKLGKTQLQKLVYFAQNNGLPLKYTFQIYHYGPYSFELSNDLGSLDALEIVNIQNDPNGYGFQVSTGKFADKFVLPVKYQKKLDRVIDQFGSESTAKLEVKATIHFVSSVVTSKKQIIEKVHALKPRYTKDFIRQSYSELKHLNWV
jgi:uncharacterized protein YwgA